MKPYKIAIFFSGVERTLAGSGYNLRVDECKSAAYDLMAFSGMEYGKYADAVLRQVPAEVFEQYKDRLRRISESVRSIFMGNPPVWRPG